MSQKSDPDIFTAKVYPKLFEGKYHDPTSLQNSKDTAKKWVSSLFARAGQILGAVSRRKKKL